MKPLKRPFTRILRSVVRTTRTVRFTACALLPWSISANAQDIHFSQFFNTPLAQNPANIGQFRGNYRMGAVYRQQWRSVTVPYSTFGMGGDAASFLGVDGLGLGYEFPVRTWTVKEDRLAPGWPVTNTPVLVWP